MVHEPAVLIEVVLFRAPSNGPRTTRSDGPRTGSADRGGAVQGALPGLHSAGVGGSAQQDHEDDAGGGGRHAHQGTARWTSAPRVSCFFPADTVRVRGLRHRFFI